VQELHRPNVYELRPNVQELHRPNVLGGAVVHPFALSGRIGAAGRERALHERMRAFRARLLRDVVFVVGLEEKVQHIPELRCPARQCKVLATGCHVHSVPAVTCTVSGVTCTVSVTKCTVLVSGGRPRYLVEWRVGH
jgi:hypothetical protein